MAVPLFDSETPLAPLRPAIIDKLAEVVTGGRFVLGPEVAAFEAEFAAYLGVAHVIGVANGTDALAIALRAMGVAPGDDVVVPSFTFYATAEAVADIGARPVFCDVDHDTRNVTVDTVRAALTPSISASSSSGSRRYPASSSASIIAAAISRSPGSDAVTSICRVRNSGKLSCAAT